MNQSKLAFRIPELADRAGVSASLLRREIRAGRGPTVTHIGGVPVIRVQDAKAWLESLAAGSDARSSRTAKAQSPTPIDSPPLATA
jgi:hypothetical protein